MDTLRSPIPQGSMGGPTGTGRPPQLTSAVGTLWKGEEVGPSAARIFSDEVDRAEERAEQGSFDERLAAQAQERRSARHESFGQAQPEEKSRPRSEVPADHATGVTSPQPESAPIVVQDDAGAPSHAPRGATDNNSGATPTASPEKGQASLLPGGGGSGAADQLATPAATQAIGGGVSAGNAAIGTVGTSSPASSTEAPAVRSVSGSTSARSGNASPESAAPQSRAKEIAEAAEILRQIKVAASSGARRITVELAPLSLGRVQIRVGLRQGGVEAIVEVDEPTTFAALERQAPELRAVLSEVTGGKAVTLTLLGGESGERRTREEGRGADTHTGGPSHATANTNTEPAPQAQSAPRFGGSGAIDTYA